MHQAFAVSSVDFIAVLIIEEGSDVLKGFRYSATDGRPTGVAFLSRSNGKGWVAGGDLCNTLPRKDVAHVN